MKRGSRSAWGMAFLAVCLAWANAGAVGLEWEPMDGAETYDALVLHNGTLGDAQTGLAGESATLSDELAPGYYTAFVRGVNGAGAGEWSEPLTFKVGRTMTPGGNTVFLKPTPFRWTRTPSATKYQLKLSKLNPANGLYALVKKVWVDQPPSGQPRWTPPAGLIGNGRYQWSVLNYNGAAKGFTTKAYFRVQKVAGANYMVIALSGGPSVTNYPVTYLSDVPSGGWTDVYRTSKLVLRRVSAGTFMMGSSTNELGYDTDEAQHQVTLTNSFYIGVFEVTQRQWELVMGNNPSYFINATYYQTRPVESVSYYDIRENPDNSAISPNWPQSSQVHADSFMGKLRAKTVLSGFDLPTESQWEYACRAGTATELNSGNNITNTTSDAHMAEVGRYWLNGGSEFSQGCEPSAGTALAGSYLPNAWGLYDMHGNEAEWCLDWYDVYPGAVTNPPGASSGATRVFRSGNWGCLSTDCLSANRNPYAPDSRNGYIGFRAVLNLP